MAIKLSDSACRLNASIQCPDPSITTAHQTSNVTRTSNDRNSQIYIPRTRETSVHSWSRSAIRYGLCRKDAEEDNVSQCSNVRLVGLATCTFPRLYIFSSNWNKWSRQNECLSYEICGLCTVGRKKGIYVNTYCMVYMRAHLRRACQLGVECHDHECVGLKLVFWNEEQRLR